MSEKNLEFMPDWLKYGFESEQEYHETMLEMFGNHGWTDEEMEEYEEYHRLNKLEQLGDEYEVVIDDSEIEEFFKKVVDNCE